MNDIRDRYYTLGIAYLNAKQYDEAIKLFLCGLKSCVSGLGFYRFTPRPYARCRRQLSTTSRIANRWAYMSEYRMHHTCTAPPMNKESHEKNILFHIYLLTFVLFAFVPNSFAQDAAPDMSVRQIYFHPRDRQPPEDINILLDKLVSEVQTFYADEMERHGFGRKTFRLETDALGEQVRYSVKGKFTTAHYERDMINMAREEIKERFDMSQHFVSLVFIEGADLSGGIPRGQVGGNAWANSFWGAANITLLDFNAKYGSLYLRAFNVIAHELGHAFGLSHDFRDDRYMMSYGPKELTNQLSYCAAEWLNVHRYFNTTHNAFDQKPSIEMLELTFLSPPNTIRLRFEITHSAGLHQAQLLTNSLVYSETPSFDPTTVIDCKSLNANNTTVEFVTTELAPASEYVQLQVIDVHGNFTDQRFPINITALLPASEPVLIPDANLASLIKKILGLRSTSPITELDMLGLGELYFYEDDRFLIGLPPPPGKEITDLTGLQHATNLERLYLNDHQIIDLTPLAGLTQLNSVWIPGNKISDINPLAGLTNLTSLNLEQNKISDISLLAELTQLLSLHLYKNRIEDIMPLKGMTNLHSLTLSANQISNEMLTVLAEFPKLELLTLSWNQISDITPLKDMTNLSYLSLSTNQISDITPLKDMTNLSYLSLSTNQIRDVSPLAELVNLERLILEGNPIKNREPLLALLQKNPDVKIFLRKDGEPLPVSLSHFRADHTGAGVVLNWTTESEVDNAGFYIYRSKTKGGEFKVVNPTMVQGAGTTGERNEYTWTDTTAKPNTVYYYQIEDVSHAGERKRLATVRLRGLVSARGKLTTTWAEVKNH